MITTETRTVSPAEVYDRSFVPALFARWGPVVAKAAGIRRGDRVLDIACAPVPLRSPQPSAPVPKAQ